MELSGLERLALNIRLGNGNHHGIDHALKVRSLAQVGLCDFKLTRQQRQAVLLAALLHDTDDPKLFTVRDRDFASSYLHCFYPDQDAKLILRMIDLVSCSKNGSATVEEKWMLIPRDADRVEALGITGIQRCLAYANEIKLPLYLATTLKARNESELETIATLERYQKYRGHSTSMVDHYYDKLLHIGQLQSGSLKLQDLAIQGAQAMREVVLTFGRASDPQVWEVQFRKWYTLA